mmetsp:Transcript_34633/g.44646  ORF Transcript_34633/g.44646 Transcript_34633/m.44646 type:complete len:321 (-) Transcript_34633:378-1340(-)
MEDPVSTMDGQTYERDAITEWLKTNDTSPNTGEFLKDKSLIPNYGIDFFFTLYSLSNFKYYLVLFCLSHSSFLPHLICKTKQKTGLKRAIAEFNEDPHRAQLIKELSLRQNTTEPAFPEETERIELLIVGPTAVGKSSLLRHLRDLKFVEDCDSTIGLDFHTHKMATETKKCNAKIWDTSGQAMFRDTIRTQYRAANCILFVFDVSRPDTLQQLKPYIEDAKMSLNDRPSELILVANKIDLRSNSEEEPLLSRGVSAEEASIFVEEHGLTDYREVSARTGANVKLTFSRSLAHASYHMKNNKQGINLGAEKRKSTSCPCF